MQSLVMIDCLVRKAKRLTLSKAGLSPFFCLLPWCGFSASLFSSVLMTFAADPQVIELFSLILALIPATGLIKVDPPSPLMIS